MKRVMSSIALCSFTLFAQETFNITTDFLTTLNEVSEIASATKLNIQKTPSTVTVLRRDFIEKSGARTFMDLIPYIPGLYTSITSSGKRQLIVRGVRNSYRDKIKFMINGVEVTNNLYTNHFYYYNFPADLIKRVEFTKTPDSVRYGDNAFLGVVNIITLDESNADQISTWIDSDNRHGITLFKSFLFHNYTVAIDAHTIYAKPDIVAPQTFQIDLWQHKAQPFRTPQPAHTLEKNRGVGIAIKKDTWSLQYRNQYYKKGNFFGIARVTPLKHNRSVHLDYQFLQLSYEKFLTPKWKIEIDGGYKYYIWNGAFRAFPYDLQPTTNPDKDLIFGAKISEEMWYAKVNWKYLSNKHNLLTQFATSYAKPKKEHYFESIPAINRYNTTQRGPLQPGIHRSIYAASIEDIYYFNDNLALSGGVRLDHYNEFDTKFSAKAGVVYNIDQENTIKYLVNYAFRAPSWIELYSNTAAEFNGNPKLQPEKILMHEVQFLKEFSPSDMLKCNLFYGKTTDTIDRKYDRSGRRIYENLGTFLIRGYELSYTKLFQNGSLSLHYAQNFDKREYMRQPGDKTKYLGVPTKIFSSNLDCTWGNLSSHTLLKLSNKIYIPENYPDIPGYFSLDQIFTYDAKAFQLQIGITNLTNHKNYISNSPSDIIARRYMFVAQNATYPRNSREFFIRIRKQF